MADENEEVHIETDEVRGGSSPGIMRYVLMISLILVIAIFAGILLYGRS